MIIVCRSTCVCVYVWILYLSTYPRNHLYQAIVVDVIYEWELRQNNGAHSHSQKYWFYPVRHNSDRRETSPFAPLEFLTSMPSNGRRRVFNILHRFSSIHWIASHCIYFISRSIGARKTLFIFDTYSLLQRTPIMSHTNGDSAIQNRHDECFGMAQRPCVKGIMTRVVYVRYKDARNLNAIDVFEYAYPAKVHTYTNHSKLGSYQEIDYYLFAVGHTLNHYCDKSAGWTVHTAQ